MSDQETRLVQCFASVFPGLSREEIRSLNSELGGPWDSLARVTLVALVEEEFKVAIDLETISELNSFAAFRGYIDGLKPTVD